MSLVRVELSNEGHYQPNNPEIGCIGSCWKETNVCYIYFDKIIRKLYYEKFHEMDQENQLWFSPSTLRGDNINEVVYRITQTVIHELIHIFDGEIDEDNVENLVEAATGLEIEEGSP